MHTGCLTTAAADTQGQPVLRTTGLADQVTHVNRPLQRALRCISDRVIRSCYSVVLFAIIFYNIVQLRVLVNVH